MSEQHDGPGPDAGAAPDAVPVCYRHPERETYVRCARCERPICPDCMVDAAVGFQCPGCVQEGVAGVRAARTPGGGLVTASNGLLTRVLIGVMVVVFVVQQLSPDDRFTRDLALNGVLVADGEYYRLVTAAFLHANVSHLFLNMLALYLLGAPLEAWLGRLRFAVVYGLSLLGGSVASFLFTAPATFALGASGAVFGLMGATYAVALKQRWDVRPVTALIAINLVIGFVIPNIDWRAHLGGLVVGGAVTLALAYAPRERRTAVLVLVVLVVLAVATVLVAYRVDELQPLVPLAPLLR